MITTPPRCASLVQVGHHAPFCYANFTSNLTKRAWRPHAAAALAAAALAANVTAPSLPRLRCRCGAGSVGDPLGCGCGGGGAAPPCTAEVLSYHSTFCWYEADAAGDCDFGGLLAGATYNATDPNPNLEGYTAAWADYNASDPNATAPTMLPTHESLPLHTPQLRSHTTRLFTGAHPRAQRERSAVQRLSGV